MRERAFLARYSDLESSPSVVRFQYNPETLRRTLAPRRLGGPRETIRCTAILDGTDAHERRSPTARVSVHARLAALELLMHPDQVMVRTPFGRIIGRSTQAPVAMFFWGQHRLLPVRVIGLHVVEELHDAALYPLRATVDITMKALTDRDLDKHPARQFWNLHMSTLRIYAGIAEGLDPEPLG